MKVQFKESISEKEFKYICKNFDFVEFVEKPSENWNIYNEVSFNSKYFIYTKSYETFVDFLEDILIEWYELFFDTINWGYYLK